MIADQWPRRRRAQQEKVSKLANAYFLNEDIGESGSRPRRQPSIHLLVIATMLAVTAAIFAYKAVLAVFSGEGPMAVSCAVAWTTDQRFVSGTIRYTVEADRTASVRLGVDFIDADGATVATVGAGDLVLAGQPTTQAARSFDLPAGLDVSAHHVALRVTPTDAVDPLPMTTTICGYSNTN